MAKGERIVSSSSRRCNPSFSEFETSSSSRDARANTRGMESSDDDDGYDDAFDRFLRWCAKVRVDVDVEAATFTARRGGGGRGVACARHLERGAVLARIPVDACLTLRACGIPELARAIEAKVVKHKASWLCETASALCVERHLGRDSRFEPYVAVLPSCEPNVVSMWSDDDRALLEGTEIDLALRDESREARREYDDVVSDVFKAHGVQCPFESYHAARTVVSSRAFQISPEIGAGLAPIADCFNHRTGGHDVVVGDGALATTSDDDALSVKVVREGGCKSGDEIFNTYGFLGNARLLNSYGFTQCDNPADSVSLSTSSIRAAAAMVGTSGAQIASRFAWIEAAELIPNPDESFEIGRACYLPDDLLYVAWACVEDEDAFSTVRHAASRHDAVTAIETAARSKSLSGIRPVLTPTVANVIASAIKRRLSMYAVIGNDRTRNERLKCAAALIESERKIWTAVLKILDEFRVVDDEDEVSKKRSKSGDDAFALFD